MAHKLPVLLFFVLLLSTVLYSLEQKHLKDLRKLRIQGVSGRVAVSMSALKDFVLNTNSRGWDFDLFVFNPGNNENLNGTSLFGELEIGYFVIYDHTLIGLSCNMKEELATSYRVAAVSVPFASGGLHGIILLALFTDSDKKVLFPFSTNIDHVTYIDEIGETENGTITLSHGNDVFVVNTQHNDTCREIQRQQVIEHFDEILGKHHVVTDYPLPFDWGCDVLCDNVNFCDILKQNQNELEEAGPNVCTGMTITSHPKRCPASMKLQEITGFFRNALPFLSAPAESFEAEWIDIEQEGGIIFPCLIFS